MGDVCGHLMRRYQGKPIRPCVLRYGHKGEHRDAAFVVMRRVYARAWRKANRLKSREYARRYYRIKQQKGITSAVHEV